MKLISPACLRSAALSFLFLLFVACGERESAMLTRFENSPTVDSLLTVAPHFIVNTDIEAEEWVANAALGLVKDSLILGRPNGIIAIADSFYISDSQATGIFVVDCNGHLVRKIGKRGKGPGEFLSLRGLEYNGTHVFVKDRGRVQIFKESMDYASSFSVSGMGTLGVSPGYMLLECPEVNKWIICARSTVPPFHWFEFKQLLPVLDLPDRTGENSYIVSISPEGNRVAVGYKGLPYIFVYDDQFTHLKTIRFEGKDVRDWTPTGIPGGAPPEVLNPGTFSFIEWVEFIDSRYLIASVHRTDNYIIDVSENEHQLVRKFVLRPTNNPEERKNIPARDFLFHRDRLYVASPWAEYVYGYSFDL